MKKTLLTVSLLLVCCWFYCDAQTPDWLWAKTATNPSPDGARGYSIVTDNFNNEFVTGYYFDSIAFGSYLLKGGTTVRNAFLTKYDSNGNVKWAKTSSGGYCEGLSVATDIFGNSFVTGEFDSIVSFDSHILVSAGLSDAFLVKYDSFGNVVWAKNAGGTNNDYGFGVSLDKSGNVYLAGQYYSSPFNIGPIILGNAGGADILLAKYDSSGNVLWARSAGGTSDERGYSVAADAWGNEYLAGYFTSPSLTFGATTLTNPGGADIFLVKYDSSGNALWVKRPVGTGYDVAWHVSADATGNAYITGFYHSSLIIFGSDTLTNLGVYDAFLVKYNPSGNVLWARNIGGTGVEQGWCVDANVPDKIVVTGGFYSPTLTLDSITLQYPNAAPNPMYIAEYDSLGQAFFAKVLSCGGDGKNAAAINPSGCIYTTAAFTLDSLIIGNDTLTNPIAPSYQNVLVAELCYISIAASFTSSDSLLCSEGNTCINFYDHSTGNPTSWQWHFTGATPDTSTQQNPTNICYSAAGTYPVSLVVKNSSGSDSLTVASMIIVASPPLPPVVTVVGGDTLYSSHGSHYQWYLNGAVIAGATDSFYVAHQGGTYSILITDQFGCHSQSAGTVITGVEDRDGVGVAVYPNPFDKTIVVSGRSGEFSLFDVTGRLLLHRLFTNSATINTDQLARGIYFYEVRDKNGVGARGKLVKE